MPAVLDDKDRIFTNLYGFQPWGLKSAMKRGDWDGTAALMSVGEDEGDDPDQDREQERAERPHAAAPPQRGR